MCNTYMNCFPYTCIQRAKLFLPPSISSVSDSLTMRHSCVDWGATQPTRKAPFLVFSYGNRHLYAAVPKSFDALEETVRKKFSLGVAQIEFYSSCGNLCGDVLTKIDEDVWELVAPCIGSITVIKTTPSTTEPVAELRSNSAEPDFFVVPKEQTASLSSSEDSCGPDGHIGRTCDSHIDLVRILPPAVGPSDPSSLPYTVGNGSGPAVEESTKPGSPAYDNHTIPLPRSPNRWLAPSLDYHGRTDMSTCSPERAKRRFTGLLNKLTRKNFYVICDRMLAWINECDEAVQGKVFRLACTLLFDRAVDEPERMGLYATLCRTMCGTVGKFRRSSGPMVPGYELMQDYMIQCWTTAFQEKNLSWGGPVRASVLTPKPVDEEYYTAERQKRRGIGLAGFTVELIKLNLFKLLEERASDEPFFQELAHNLEDSPTEGDVVSLCILLQNVAALAEDGNMRRSQIYNNSKKAKARSYQYHDYQEACSAMASKLAGSYWGDNGVSPRLRCRLLDLADLYECRLSPNHRWITFHFAHDGLRYSIPEASGWCVTRLTTSKSLLLSADQCFSLVDRVDHWWLIRSLVTRTWINNTAIRGFLAKASQMCIYSSEALEEGLIAAIKVLDVSTTQNSEVYHNIAVVMKVTGFYKEEERFMRVARHAQDSEKLIQLTLW